MPESVQQQVQTVKEALQYFTPAGGLPVTIDFSDAENPYQLAQEVIYDNGIVRVTLEQGFRWDGASIPVWIPIVPWVLTVAVMQFWAGPILWAATALLVAYTLRLLPYMQKMGLHARAMCIHDKLYRAQKVARVVADAIAETIMEYDGVPVDVRWIIYRRLRQFGWIAWRKNRRALAAKAEAARAVEVNK